MSSSVGDLSDINYEWSKYSIYKTQLIYLYWCNAEYGYNEKSAKGPRHWGDLKREWAACKGEMQSPIDLSSDRVSVMIPEFGDLKRNYKPQHATISNRGHDVAVST